MKILVVGDVVGAGGVEYLERTLRTKIDGLGADMTVVNGENSAPNNGIDTASAKALLAAGADVITTGNHVYKHSTFHSFLENSENVIRPLNYPSACPGNGYTYINISGYRILVMNVLGVVLGEPLNCPFDSVERVLDREKGRFDAAILDIHAETTSEKAAIARYFDGRISVVFGTHTHVQTSDARILPKGTGFITDVGMCGPVDSILGVESGIIIDKLRLHLPKRFDIAGGEISANAALFELDDNGKCIKASAFTF